MYRRSDFTKSAYKTGEVGVINNAGTIEDVKAVIDDTMEE